MISWVRRLACAIGAVGVASDVFTFGCAAHLCR